MSYKYREEQWLKKNYFDEKKSTYEIAEECNVDPKTVLNWMNRYGLETRSISERNHLAKANSANLSNKALSFIEGELLGDGSVVVTSNYSALYSHSSKYRGYLEWLKSKLASFSVESSDHSIHKKKTDWGNLWHYQSKSYPVLLELREKWYGEKKEIPKNFSLDPLSARQWYIGDGSLTKSRQKSNYRITFCTESFTKAGNHLLQQELQKQGIDCYVSDNSIGHRLHVKTNSVIDFLDWIKPCPKQIEEYYDYKWVDKSEYRKTRLRKKEVKEIKRALKETDKSHKEISRPYNVSRSLISLINLDKRWGHIEI